MKTKTLVVRNKVLSALNDYSMIKDASHIVVGFSGGADSVCLLHILNSIKNDHGFQLSAAHINHGIRGDEAERDAEFCRDFCNRYDIPFSLLEVDCVALSAEKGQTLEECGRDIRYNYFQELCENNTYRIATAHNANDNAETLLFNLARGTGLRGASGIPRVRSNIIRPLINCTRDEIEAYCNENNLSYVVDSTNLCDDYTRNKIRHSALPVLEDVNSGVIKNISSFTENVADVCDFIKASADTAVKSADMGNGFYDAAVLMSLHKAVLSESIIAIFGEISNDTLDRQKVSAVISLIKTKGRIQIYDDIYAECFKNCFRFFRKDNLINDNEITVDPVSTDSLVFNGYALNFTKYANCSKKFNKNVLDNLIDCDKIVGNLKVRTRREGDRFSIQSRKVSKTVKKLFNELSVPVEVRDKIPVLCDDEGVVWIYSIGTNSRCRINNNSSNIIFIGGETND